MAITKVELAAKILGVESTRKAASKIKSSTIVGTAYNDSKDGYVLVDLGGYVLSADGSQYISLATTADVRAGDKVYVMLRGADGTAMGATVIGSAGGGDRTKGEVAANTEAIESLSVKKLDADVANITYATIDNLNATNENVENLTANKANVTDLTAATARIGTLEANRATVTDLNAATARIDTLESDHVTAKDFKAAQANISNLKADKANVTDLTAATARIGTLEANRATVTDLKATNAEIDNLKANKADIDLANIANGTIKTAMIGAAQIISALIKDEAVIDSKILSMSANKLTAGTIDAGKITVINLNADNINTGKLTVGGITIDVTNNKSVVDGASVKDGTITLSGLSQEVKDEIDGAIQTWTVDAVPLLTNDPASAWTTTAERNKHVGDIAYVVNSASNQNGFSYRFTKSSSGEYSWTLIQDSDIQKALGRLDTAEGNISDLKTFDQNVATWENKTDDSLSKLTIRATTIESNLGSFTETKFNELSSSVDGNKSSITSLAKTVTNNETDIEQKHSALEQTVNGLSSSLDTLSQTVSDNETNIEKKHASLSQTVDGISSNLSSLKTTVTENETDIENKHASLSQTVDGISSNVVSLTKTVGSQGARLSTAESSIKQNADEISTKVASSTYNTYVTANDKAVAKAQTAADNAQSNLDKYKSSNGTAVADAKKAGTDAKAALDAYETTVKDTYATKTALTQTSTELSGKISDTLTTAKTYTDSSIETEVTNRNAAIKAQADSINLSVSKTYTKYETFSSYQKDADGRIATANSNASTAKSTAQTAASDAATAKTNASSAVSTANAASSNASKAVSTANSAASTAGTAKSTADAAKSSASTAVSTANAANSTAGTAKATATAAQAKADDAWARTLRVEVMSAPKDAAGDTSLLTAYAFRGGELLSDEAVAKMGLLAWYAGGKRVATGNAYTCKAGTAAECRLEA